MRLISAIKPTGILTLGNYIGLIKNLEKIQNEFDEIFIFIADLHALTFPIDPKILEENSKKIAAFFLASNLDMKKTILFLQSDVPEHSELNTILQNFLYIGEMNRMTQFKQKAREGQKNNLSLGFFAYPSLMCADIVLHNANVVPVGDDQIQHIELTRKLVERFNNRYNKNIFVLPKAEINDIGYRIMDLKNPLVKMSKSSSQAGTISIDDSDDIIRKKIMSAVTDSDSKIKYDVKNKPGISNLLVIYASLKKKDLKKCEEYFKNYKYSEFKREVANAVVEELSLFRKKYMKFLQGNKYITDVLHKGSEKARLVASKTLKKVKKIIGFYGKK